MARFRGSDETLDQEIGALEAIVRVRLRRAARELRDLDNDLRELKVERARRRGVARAPAGVEEPAAA